MEVFYKKFMEKKGEKSESLPVFQEFKCKNPVTTLPVSPCGKQGLSCSPNDHFIGSCNRY